LEKYDLGKANDTVIGQPVGDSRTTVDSFEYKECESSEVVEVDKSITPEEWRKLMGAQSCSLDSKPNKKQMKFLFF